MVEMKGHWSVDLKVAWMAERMAEKSDTPTVETMVDWRALMTAAMMDVQ